MKRKIQNKKIRNDLTSKKVNKIIGISIAILLIIITLIGALI